MGEQLRWVASSYNLQGHSSPSADNAPASKRERFTGPIPRSQSEEVETGS